MTTGESPFTRSRKPYNPLPHQIRGLKLLVENGGARLFLKPGKGKTGVVLKAFDILKKVGYVDCLLVLAPLRVITTSWPQELDKWDFCEKFKYQTIHGGKTARLEAMDSDADVYLMNVEGLLSSEWRLGPKARGYPCNEVALAFLRGRRVMVAIDESTKFKNGSSSRYKVLKKYLKYFARRVIMTGTPKPNKLEDLFHQCYLTDLGADLGGYVTHFRMHYMMPDPASTNHAWIPQFGALERVAAKIAPTTLQLEQDEAVPVTEHDIWVEMPDELRAKYKELEKDFLTEIEGKTIMAFNGGVKWGKLKQFAQGAIYLTEGRPGDGYMELFDSKLDALENLLEELNGEPAFLLTAYKHDVERISQRLGRPVPYIGSGTSAAQGAAWCKAFGAGAIPLLAGHPLSVAHGVDGLQQHCKTVIWFGNTPSWEEEYQANCRVVRLGNEADNVDIYHIRTRCGVERAIKSIVENKMESEATILEEIRKNLVY